jgi:uncharacterized protein YjgD (DUF1641 family)
MAEAKFQEQIDSINRKLDILLESVEEQKRRREEFDDLVDDVSIVARDAFRQTVTVLDKAQVELDSCGISCLMIKVLQNLGTFHEMLDMLESARDFMKDVSPILHQVGLDAVHKMNELEQKGYFAYLAEIGTFLDKWVQSFTADDLRRLGDNAGAFANIIRNLTSPEIVSSLDRVATALATVKPDEKLDDKSLWQLFRELSSPEVRQSLSYSLRLVKAINN